MVEAPEEDRTQIEIWIILYYAVIQMQIHDDT